MLRGNAMHSVLSEREQLTLLHVLNELLTIETLDQFLDWVDSDVRLVLPHECFICGAVDIREKPATMRILVTRNVPSTFFERFRQQNGSISTPCLRQWAKGEEPQ